MGLFSRFEGKMEDTFEGAADKMSNSPISPIQIIKKAEKQMRREKIVSAGKQYAPTLFTILVNADDDQRLFGFYPTLAGETETRLEATAVEDGLVMDGQPLVRFIVDESLKHGKFDVIAEVVSAPIIEQLRAEEMQRYGMNAPRPQQPHSAYTPAPTPGAIPTQPNTYQQESLDPFAPNPTYAASLEQQAPINVAPKPPLPYVPQDEIDYSLSYGEYTFDSQNFEDYNKQVDDQGQQVSLNDEQVNMLNTSYSDDMSIPAVNPNCSVAELFAQAENEPVNQTADSVASIQSEELYANSYHKSPAQQGHQLGQQQVYAQQQVQQQTYNREQTYAQQYSQTGYPQPSYASQGCPQPGYGATPQGYPQPQPQQRYNPYGAPATTTFVSSNGYARQNQAGPQVAVRAHLMDTTTHRTYDLAAQRVLLGRERTCNIVVNDINASRTHAEIHFEPQGVWVITDLGSTNGTLVNGTPITRRGLQDGDRITLGITDFIFSLR